MESLIAKSKVQPSLFNEEQDDQCTAGIAYERMESKGRYTAERLFEQRPETYKQVVALSARKMGQLQQAELLGVHPSTVRQVQRREKAFIDILKEEGAAQALNGAALCFEEINERLMDPIQRAKVPVKDLAIAGGILAQRGLELKGEVVPGMEAGDFKAGVEAFAEFCRQMGSVGETVGQKGGDPVDRAKQVAPIVDLEQST